MRSTLEDYPKLLEKVGLFIVLFNAIDSMLNTEFYFKIDQTNDKTRPILDNLISQDFSKKLDMLEIILGNDLYLKIKDLNDFRNFIAHGMYGVNELKGISISKRKRYSGKYENISLNEEIINKHVDSEREVMDSIYKLILGKIPRVKNNK